MPSARTRCTECSHAEALALDDILVSSTHDYFRCKPRQMRMTLADPPTVAMTDARLRRRSGSQHGGRRAFPGANESAIGTRRRCQSVPRARETGRVKTSSMKRMDQRLIV